MFDFVRNNTKIMMGILFLLIIPSFVLFGLEGYSRFNDKGAVVAKVNGNKINQTDWDAAHKREVDRIRASMPNIDAKLFDTAEAKYATLERLVRDQVITAAAQKLQLVASDTRLARELQQSPVIAALRTADGKLDMERYKQLAASQGMTPEMFEMQVRADLSNRQVIQGVQASAYATSAQTQTAMNAFMQRREVQILNFPASDYLGGSALDHVNALNLSFAIMALLSITLGTLYQKSFVKPCDVRTANTVQLLAALLVTTPLALLETESVQFNAEFIGAMAWSVLGLTLGGSSLLYMLIQKGAAASVTSLMYLVPPCTALVAWLLFDEPITAFTLVGIALTAWGVSWVVRPSQSFLGEKT